MSSTLEHTLEGDYVNDNAVTHSSSDQLAIPSVEERPDQ
jgi:hypothetical protein